mmetsp:Transcript_82742/g.146539  ORF Transcript_82742/g.146539 Transcript_82742/m.146539 type:complete len:355 (-) Transcript_82742:59-1123(-)
MRILTTLNPCLLLFLRTWRGCAVAVSSSQSSVKPLRAESEVRLFMPQFIPAGPLNFSSFTMNVTIVDAQNPDFRPMSLSGMVDEEPMKTSRKRRKRKKEADNTVSVISSWVLFHMPGNHTDALQAPMLPNLVGALRNGIADGLEVCRSSLGIVDMRAINIDVMDKEPEDLPPSTDIINSDKSPKGSSTLLEHAQMMMRRMRSEERTMQHVNVTQIKAVYEVRVFPEMRTTESEVGRRVDKFQIYSKFSDLSRLLARSLSEVDIHQFDGVTLDDVGYASKHTLVRPPLSTEDLNDCTEEGLLHDARQVHQFVVAVSLIMVALITCAGSTVFTIKHASSVPSRMNPLISISNNDRS